MHVVVSCDSCDGDDGCWMSGGDVGYGAGVDDNGGRLTDEDDASDANVDYDVDDVEEVRETCGHQHCTHAHELAPCVVRHEMCSVDATSDGHHHHHYHHNHHHASPSTSASSSSSAAASSSYRHTYMRTYIHTNIHSRFRSCRKPTTGRRGARARWHGAEVQQRAHRRLAGEAPLAPCGFVAEARPSRRHINRILAEVRE